MGRLLCPMFSYARGLEVHVFYIWLLNSYRILENQFIKCTWVTVVFSKQFNITLEKPFFFPTSAQTNLSRRATKESWNQKNDLTRLNVQLFPLLLWQ